MNWDFRRWQDLAVELCLSLVCVRTHLVSNKPEQCPASNYEIYSLPDPRVQWPTHTLSTAPLQTHSSVSSITLWEETQAHYKELGKKSHFNRCALFGKAPNSRTFPKGLFELALGALLWSLQRQHKGCNGGQIQNPDNQSLKGKNPKDLDSTPTQQL